MDETCEPDTKLQQAVCYPAPTIGTPAPFAGSRYAPSPTIGDCDSEPLANECLRERTKKKRRRSENSVILKNLAPTIFGI